MPSQTSAHTRLSEGPAFSLAAVLIGAGTEQHPLRLSGTRLFDQLAALHHPDAATSF